MKKAQLPLTEEVRLAELQSYNILDTPGEKEFDELAELLRQVTGMDYCAITFVDRSRQWFKAGTGLSVTETPRDISLCSWTILENKVMVVSDPLNDERFHDNPFIEGELGIRFYAGSPIVTQNGHNIGTVCVYDKQARDFSDAQQRSLQLIAAQVTKLLELRMKNQLILEKAAEMLSIERRTLQMTLLEQESERKSIGIELHENFAQVLAACMMYLNIAQESPDLRGQFMVKAHDELANLLHDVRKLSRAFNPISVESISLEEILRDYLNECQEKRGLSLRLEWKGNHSLISGDSALNLFRIIVQYIDLISKQPRIKSVLIRVEVKQQLILTVHSDGDPAHIDLAEKKLAINAILSRIDLCEGKYELKVTHQRNTVFRVMIPLALPVLAA